MRLKDDTVEKEQISERKAVEEYRFLKAKLEYTYSQYLEQKKGLQIRKQKLKKERDDCFKMIIGIIIVSFILSHLPVYVLISPIVVLVIMFLLPFYMIGAIEKSYQYAVMMEKSSNINAIAKSQVVTYMAEERFLNKEIAKYKEELDKNYTEDELTDDVLFELNKMTTPKPYYATPINRDFKRTPLFLILIFCVGYFLFTWIQTVG